MNLSKCIVCLVYFGFISTLNHCAFAMETDEDGAGLCVKPKIGLVLQAGGLKAANNGAGYMRGFQQQRIMIDGESRPGMEVFDFVAGSSGGNVPTFLYHYASKTSIDDLLDAQGNSDPSKITNEDLETIPPKSMFTTFTTSVAFALLAGIFVHLLSKDVPVIETALDLIVLKPMGIDSEALAETLQIRDDVKSKPLLLTSMVGPVELYPDWLADDIKWTKFIAAVNAEIPDKLKLTEGRDGYTNNNTLMYEIAQKVDSQLTIPGYLSHDKLNVLYQPSTLKYETTYETAEPVNYKPFAETYSSLSTDSNPFTVKKMLAMAVDLTAILIPSLSANPATQPIAELFRTGLSVDIPTADGKTRDMAFSDGGYNDFVGLPLMLNEQVDKIVLSLHNSGDHPTRTTPERVLEFYLAYYFGIGLTFPQPSQYYASFQEQYLLLNHVLNVTAADGTSHFEKLLSDVKALRKAGEPIVAAMHGVEVIDNPFWNIKAGGRTVDIVVCVNTDVPGKFAEQLPEDVASPPPGMQKVEDGYFTNEEYSAVPNQGPAAIKLPVVDISIPLPLEYGVLPQKVARMSHIIASWSIGQAWNGLTDANGVERFEGFPAFFYGDKKEENELKHTHKLEL